MNEIARSEFNGLQEEMRRMERRMEEGFRIIGEKLDAIRDTGANAATAVAVHESRIVALEKERSELKHKLESLEDRISWAGWKILLAVGGASSGVTAAISQIVK